MRYGATNYIRSQGAELRTHPRLLDMLRETIVGAVGRDKRDLTARQLAVLLVCCLDDPPQAMTALKQKLNLSGPAITKAVDRLVALDLVVRVHGPTDRRIVLAMATASTRAFVQELQATVVTAAERDAKAGTVAAAD